MVDDLLTISECGYKTNLMNQYINMKTGCKSLQFGTSKSIQMHVGRGLESCSELEVHGTEMERATEDTLFRVEDGRKVKNIAKESQR